LCSLRRRHPGLRGEGLNVFYVNNDNRILAFHRWVEGTGRDVVIVVSLNESTFYNHSYQLGFPLSGQSSAATSMTTFSTLWHKATMEGFSLANGLARFAPFSRNNHSCEQHLGIRS
jgi:hypothetical protein